MWSRMKRNHLLLFVLAWTMSATATSAGSSTAPPTLNEPFQTSFERLPHAPCATLYHRKGRIGCGTFDRSAMTGLLLDSSTFTSGVASGSATTAFPPFVAVMDQHAYTATNVQTLIDFGQSVVSTAGAVLLRGILILNSTAAPPDEEDAYYSPGSKSAQNTPSEYLTPNPYYEWNVNHGGDGLIARDMYGIPAVYVTDDTVSSHLYQVALSQSATASRLLQTSGKAHMEDFYPAIVAQFDYYMGPDSQTSSTCLSWIDTDGVWRPKCLPLGGNSVWAMAGTTPDASNNDDPKSIILVATNIDSTSMFHDVAPGANSAASNILALIMAARLLGMALSDDVLDELNKNIVFAFFQGEMFGYLGSRSFLRDLAYPGFQCDDGRTVLLSKGSNKKGCLNPLRPDLDFTTLGGDISGMIAVDQVGALSTDKTFYVHGGEYAGGDAAAFLSNVMLELDSSDWTIQKSSVAYNDGSLPIPPTPLASLLSLSEGQTGGVVLAGYDEAYADEALYQSHLDSNSTRSMSMESIATAATVIARTALASAYDDGSENAQEAAAYAADLIAALDANDETLLELADCFLTNGNCDLLLKYGKVEQMNDRETTGLDLGLGAPLGTPPSYYPSIFDASNGQAFVQIGTNWYGAYTGDETFGAKDTDTFLLRPSLLEMGLHGLLNDYLGRQSTSSGVELVACETTSDCSSASYCSSAAVCTGGKLCVCSRAHYHLALDEAIVPSPNNSTGVFVTLDEESGDEGISAMYTEPYWSSTVGVRVYRDGGTGAGYWTLGAGAVVGAAWIGSSLFLRHRLQKEKLY